MNWASADSGRIRPSSAKSLRSEEDKFVPILSHKLKKVGGYSLRSWLTRRGKSFQDHPTSEHKEELRSVFELFELNDNPGFFPSSSFVVACKMLSILQDPRLLPPLPPILTFLEFESQLKKLGYGKRDILVELYNPETRRWLEDTKSMLDDSMPANLKLLHMRRQKSIQSLPMSDDDKGELSPYHLQQFASRPERDSSSVSAAKVSLAEERSPAASMQTEVVIMVLFGRHAPSNVFSLKKMAEVALLAEIRGQSQRTAFKKVGPSMTWGEALKFRYSSDASVDSGEKVSLSVVCKAHQSPALFSGDPVLVNVRRFESKDRWISLECRAINHDTFEMCLSFRRVSRSCAPALAASELSSEGLDSAANEGMVSTGELEEAAEENEERLRRLIAWEEGVDLVASKHHEGKESEGIFFPDGQHLRAFCGRTMTVYSEPEEVAAKLKTNFARDFPFERWSSEKGRRSSLKNVQAKIKNLSSLKFLSYIQKSNRDEAPAQFVKLALKGRHCVGLDESGNIFSWGDSKVKGPLNLMMKEYDDKVVERMINKSFSTKEVEVLDANQEQQRIKQRNDDWEMYLQNKSDFICMLQSKPFILKSMLTVFVFDVALGVSHCAALSREGHVYTWGCGDYGKLGHGGLWDVAQPRLVQALQRRRSIQIACGANHTLALTDNSMLWTWGDGRFGQLGHGNFQDSGLPRKVMDPESERQEHLRVRLMACGEDFSAAITSESRLLTWGNGWHGQLGHRRMTAEAGRTRRSDVDQLFLRVPSLSLLTQPKQETARGNSGRGRGNAEDPRMQEILNRLKVYEAKMRCNLGFASSPASLQDDGRARACSLPRPVALLSDIDMHNIACGSRHVLAYSQSPPRVWAWGEGRGNKLGQGTCFDQYEPSEILAASVCDGDMMLLRARAGA
eukprot:170344-Hanusia_phi.AAC.4